MVYFALVVSLKKEKKKKIQITPLTLRFLIILMDFRVPLERMSALYQLASKTESVLSPPPLLLYARFVCFLPFG